MLSARFPRLPGADVDPSPTGLYALGTRLASAGVSFVGGILTLLLLSPERIGVFLSLTGLSAFSAICDLGLTYSLLLAASSRSSDKAGPVAWAAFGVAAVTVPVAGTLLFAGGATFLILGEVAAERWFWPWLAFCVLACVQILLTLALTYVEGTGQRKQAWRANFWIEVVAGAVFVGIIVAGHELWALAGSALVRVVMIPAIIARFFHLPERGAVASGLALWRSELWPMQWKNLVNVLSGLLTTRLLTPMLLAAQGAAVAGQVGLMLALAYMLTATASVLPLSQSGLYVRLYHEGRGIDLNAAFRRTFTAGIALAILSFIGAGVFCTLLRGYSEHMATRLPEPVVIWLVLAIAPIGFVTSCLATVMRAQRDDPAVIPNLVLTLPVLVVLGLAAQTDARLFAATNLGTGVVVALLYAVLFRRFLNKMAGTA
jgi:hypothetical protein